jgi:hypothetical protein
MKQKKKNDQRGRHTKESRRRKKIKLLQYVKECNAKDACPECCSQNEFVLTVDGGGYVCTDCGMVQSDKVMDKQVETPAFLFKKSFYLHRNYFSERMSQWIGQDPPFTSGERSAIHSCWSLLHQTNKYIWSNNRSSWSKSKFGEICRTLNACFPDQDWKKKIEKWIQAKRVIYNELDDTLPGSSVLNQMKILFDPVAFCYAKYFKDKDGKHNIPRLDIVCLVLLYNISKQHVIDFGWYFLNEFIVWESQSMIETHKRATRIFCFINAYWADVPHKKFVRDESFAWLRHNKYKIPSLSRLCDLIRLSEDGRNTITHLYMDNKNKFILE